MHEHSPLPPPPPTPPPTPPPPLLPPPPPPPPDAVIAVSACGGLVALAFTLGLVLGLLCLVIDRVVFRRPYAFKGAPGELHASAAYPYAVRTAWATPHSGVTRPSLTHAYDYGPSIHATPGTPGTLSLDLSTLNSRGGGTGRPSRAQWSEMEREMEREKGRYAASPGNYVYAASPPRAPVDV